MDELIKSLRRKRGNIQGSITTFVKILDNWRDDEENRDLDYLQVALGTMQKAFEKFPDIQDQIEELDETECSKREPMQTSHDRALARARKYIRENQPLEASFRSIRTSSPVRTPSIPVTLPTITLPKFDGSSEQWASFYDIFSSLIDKNADLSPVRKLQYLRLSLSEHAARSIQSLETTDHNYEIALSILKKKYECTRRILRRHRAILREYPRLQRDSPASLSQLVDTIHQHVRALENMGAPVDSWDIPLIDLILTKISSTTSWHWELTLKDNKMPKYTELLSFLEKRANCVEFSTSNENPNPSKTTAPRPETTRSRKSGPTQVQAFATSTAAPNAAKNSKTACLFCSGPHSIYQCESFQSRSVDQRQKAIANLSLCFNCLGRGHSMHQCPSEKNCRKCNKRHHSLLHKPLASNTASEPQQNSETGIPETSQQS